MSPGAHATSYSPYPIGESPFRVKGVLYLGTQSFFTDTSKGGLDALKAELGEGPLWEFISQRFLPSGLYDVLPVPALIDAEAAAFRMTLPTYLKFRTRWQATRDIGGVYKLLLKLASPETVAARLPKVLTQMFDFATVETTLEPNASRVRIAGVPTVLEPWLETAIGVYSETALKLAGAQHVTVTGGAQPEGLKHRVAVATLVYDTKWS